MRVDWLWIEDYKNLKDVTIDFNELSWMTVLIGPNGTGKSNVLEFLTIVFRDLMLGEKKPRFRFEIRYECRGNLIHIDANPGSKRGAYQAKFRTYTLRDKSNHLPHRGIQQFEGEKVSTTKLVGEESLFLPQFLFGYYSGLNDRLEEEFSPYFLKHRNALLNGEDSGFKRLLYCQKEYSNFVLLCFFLSKDQIVRDFLEKELSLTEDGLDYILFILREPYWTSREGDSRFWNSRGVVKDFLASLYDQALAPLRFHSRSSVNAFQKKTREHLFLFIKDLADLRKLSRGVDSKTFFQRFESTLVSDLIEDVRVKVRIKNNDQSITFRDFSEGEQQLLTVLGLLHFTKEQESLFLLDEPDTHLNPQWSTKYLDHLKDFLGENSLKDNGGSHVILTTHNPIAVAELSKEQIQILKRNPETNQITASEPDIDPRGMGYAGVITSDMFGLSSALDSYTEDLLEQKRQLIVKEALSNIEKRNLDDINEKLLDLGFRTENRDEVFSKFLKARHRLLKEIRASNKNSSLELTQSQVTELVKSALKQSDQN